MTKKELENKFLSGWCPDCECEECPMLDNGKCKAISGLGDEERAELIKIANEYAKEHPDQLKDRAGTLDELIASETIDEAAQGCSIKDSGERTQYSTGAVRDCKEGKGRCDLMPLDVVAGLLNSEPINFIAVAKERGEPDCLYDAICSFSAHEWEPGGGSSESFVPNALLEVSKHFEEGAKKYGENNWQRGIPVHSYIDSAVRHYLKYCAGWNDEPHDRAFVWNLMCCIWTMEHHPELDDFTEKREKDD